MGNHSDSRARRDVLREMLTGGLSVGAVSALAGCQTDTPGQDSLTGSATDTTRIRRSIASLQQSDPNNIIPTFKKAIKEMNALPASDPRSWQNQVAIHGEGRSDWQECEHGNWLFLPWHRLYLFYFEEICRDLTGNENFALPFWNWAANHQIPSIFSQNHGNVTLSPGGNNPLYNSSRRNTTGDSITSSPFFSSSWGTGEMERTVLGDPNFLQAVGGGWPGSQNPNIDKGEGTGQLEDYHNSIHGFVGGDMGSANSPNDPIFWTHHCFVDCVWWEWNARRGHSNTNDQDWLDGISVGGTAPAFENPKPRSSLSRNGDFVDTVQSPITGSDATSFATLFMPLFDYYYENVTKGATPKPTGTPAGTTEATETLEDHLEEGADVDLRLAQRFPIREDLTVRVDEPVSVETEVTPEELAPVLDGERPGQLVLTAKDVLPPGRQGIITHVFVNRPRALAEPTEDPAFVGNLFFFELRDHSHSQYVFLKATDTLRRLRERGELPAGEPLTFQFVARFVEGMADADETGEPALTIGAFDLDHTISVVDGATPVPGGE